MGCKWFNCRVLKGFVIPATTEAVIQMNPRLVEFNKKNSEKTMVVQVVVKEGFQWKDVLKSCVEDY